jgi:ectoine hydroxylase-related dioxygenase (phytanoyl-CoA dioxygenase family)
MSRSAGQPPLGVDEVDRFRREGYLLYRDQLFDREDLETLDGIFEEQRRADPGKVSDEFDTPHFQDRRLLDYLLAPQVLDLVECLVGPDIILWSSHFICKDPRVGRATPWHEDSAYWLGRLDHYDRIVTVWLALDEVGTDNGCMKVVPGSHLAGGFSKYTDVDQATNTFSREIAEVDRDKAVPFLLSRGECSLHDGRIMHGADANSSDRRRLGYTMRYLSARTRVLPEANVGHRLWLARGRPVAANEFVNA